MTQSVLWQTFSTLQNLERKHFGQWLASPFFCRKPALAVLYAYLQGCLDKKCAPTNEAALEHLAIESVAELRTLMSELLAQMEDFLVYQERWAPAADYHIHLAAAYRKRGLPKHFEQALRRARKDWEDQPHRHSDYYEAQTNIEYEQYQQQSSAQRTEAFQLQALFDATDTAFIIRKLRHACFALTHQTVYKTEYALGLLPLVLQHLEQTPQLLQLPAVALYYHCHNFLTDPEQEAHFDRFKALLIDHAEVLPADMQRDLYLLAINYCVKKINQQKTAYFRTALDLYLFALKADLLLENGHISPFAYNNIVAIALKVGEGAWAEKFVQDYAPLLEKKHREANFQLNLARIAYARKDYRQALLHLQEADYKDLINNLIAKTLLLKIYYETGEYDALDAHLQSMQSFLRRQRVIGYHYDNYRNIIRLTRKLVQHNPHDRQAQQALRTEIEQTLPLAEKQWLLEMTQ